MCWDGISGNTVIVSARSLPLTRSDIVSLPSIWKMAAISSPFNGRWDTRIYRWPRGTQKYRTSCWWNAIKITVPLDCCKAVPEESMYKIKRGFVTKTDPLSLFQSNSLHPLSGVNFYKLRGMNHQLPSLQESEWSRAAACLWSALKPATRTASPDTAQPSNEGCIFSFLYLLIGTFMFQHILWAMI